MVAVRVVVDEGLMLVLEREMSRQKGRSDIMAVGNGFNPIPKGERTMQLVVI